MAEMEVVVPVAPPPPVDFNFDSTCSSPYMTAPSSPQRFGNFFFSAPASPTRTSALYRELRDVSLADNSSSSSSWLPPTSPAIAFDWEGKPGTPKREQRRNKNNDLFDDDDDDDYHFEFNFSGHLERTSLSADELFDGGKIRPLKPPPGYDSSASSPRSPKSSPRTKDSNFDPFEAAIEETRRREFKQADQDHHHQQEDSQHAPPPPQPRRGRERISSSYNSIRKGSRSLSPLRVSDVMLEQEEINSTQQPTTNVKIISSTSNDGKTSYLSSILTAMSFSKGNKRWKLKDLLLFRSASEGRATGGKDPLKKYTVLSKKEAAEEVKNASFRSTDSVGSSASFSSRRRGPPVSAHEMHYTVNRAISEEMRRRTFLPYKQGLLGCLGFNPAMHEISRGTGSLTRV